MTDPVSTAFPASSPGSRGDVIDYLRARVQTVFQSVTEAEGLDLSGYRIIRVRSNGRTYEHDAASTAASDHASVLVDTAGNRFVWVPDISVATLFDLVGDGAPDNGAGEDGQTYFDASTGDVYVKAGGSWGSAAGNLKGPAGADGTSGTNGLGWTGATYNAATGRVSFASDDGLDFETGDLRGAPGTAADAYAVILTPDAAETAIAEGYYTCTMRARASGTFANFFAILTHGASGDEVQVSVAKNGTIDAGVLVGAAIVHGPVTVAYGSPVTTGSLSIAVAAGDAIHFLVEGVTGAPFGGQFQIDGAA